ncbi:hypothetical protein GUJ93_ZPchr0009g1891 [Zizania palustris]|uniref:Uncharacterized protein n=1 Tax=Zizania palustris TaxID=103762 RepID=A0A8J5R7Z4_ZIZPA|nr:hypothetical protein GUJ93_ZPchr0009g1891 [Zizania palustris]
MVGGCQIKVECDGNNMVKGVVGRSGHRAEKLNLFDPNKKIGTEEASRSFSCITSSSSSPPSRVCSSICMVELLYAPCDLKRGCKGDVVNGCRAGMVGGCQIKVDCDGNNMVKGVVGRSGHRAGKTSDAAAKDDEAL